MLQIFPRSINIIVKASILGGLLGVVLLGGVAWAFWNSPYVTKQYVPVQQPIPFSHRHHVGQLGFDCRYCHTSFDELAFAGIPPTQTCMNCHAQVYADSPMLKPVHDSFKSGEPIVWRRVYNLADYVYFDHSVHVAKGIGCASCHGQVDQMPVVYKATPMTMAWCLDCHRNPKPHVRPRSEITNMQWTPPPDADRLRTELMKQYDVQPQTSCSTCHR